MGRGGWENPFFPIYFHLMGFNTCTSILHPILISGIWCTLTVCPRSGKYAHLLFFYQPMIALRNPNGNFDTYLFHILHHTRFGYQKLTLSFLLQRLQIWYFMVIYRYLIERDISIDKHDLFPDIGFSQGISGIANSQFFTLFNGENTKWVYYRYLYAPICQGLLSGLFRIQFCDFAIANLN